MQAGVEAGDRQAVRERERFRAAIARLHDEGIVDEVEHDLEFGVLVVEATRG